MQNEIRDPPAQVPGRLGICMFQGIDKVEIVRLKDVIRLDQKCAAATGRSEDLDARSSSTPS